MKKLQQIFRSAPGAPFGLGPAGGSLGGNQQGRRNHGGQNQGGQNQLIGQDIEATDALDGDETDLDGDVDETTLV